MTYLGTGASFRGSIKGIALSRVLETDSTVIVHNYSSRTFVKQQDIECPQRLSIPFHSRSVVHHCSPDPQHYKKMQLDINIEPTLRFPDMANIDKQMNQSESG